jgi:hypothetical protein
MIGGRIDDWVIRRMGDTIAAKLLYRRVGIAHKNIANSSFNGGQCPPYIDCLKKSRADHDSTAFERLKP